MANNSFSVFLRLLWRDSYIYLHQVKNYIINYSLIYPALFSLTYGYIMPNTVFDPKVLPSFAVLLIGSATFLFLILPVTLNISFLLDLEGDRYVDYQITLLSPRLVILERIIFTSLFNFIVLMPFFGVSKLILKDNFDTSNVSLAKFLIIIYLISFTMCAYANLAMCIIKGSHQIGNWWRRINSPMLLLGGSWTPWFIIYKFSPAFAYFLLINPVIYATEGIRGAILGEALYIPFAYCLLGLLIYSAIFVCLTFYFFKKRVDHI